MVYFVFILIFGLILNNIVNKVEIATKTYESVSLQQIEDSTVPKAEGKQLLSTSSIKYASQKSISSISGIQEDNSRFSVIECK